MPDAHPPVPPSRPETAAEMARLSVRGARAYCAGDRVESPRCPHHRRHQRSPHSATLPRASDLAEFGEGRQKLLVEAGVSKYAADDRPGRSGSRTLGDLVAWRYCRWTQEDDHDA